MRSTQAFSFFGISEFTGKYLPRNGAGHLDSFAFMLCLYVTYLAPMSATGHIAMLSEETDAASFVAESASGKIMLAHGLESMVAVARFQHGSPTLLAGFLLRGFAVLDGDGFFHGGDFFLEGGFPVVFEGVVLFFDLGLLVLDGVEEFFADLEGDAGCFDGGLFVLDHGGLRCFEDRVRGMVSVIGTISRKFCAVVRERGLFFFLRCRVFFCQGVCCV